ncbi:MacS family sensor histidine kinase [Dactylosporangium sp. CA-139114]|uniref:MacS family sensor histidine kinase n=1 Tax=Dactylosporangium sp. CA-139114 TaxID=3239931 RepID=UPI003D973C72
MSTPIPSSPVPSTPVPSSPTPAVATPRQRTAALAGALSGAVLLVATSSARSPYGGPGNPVLNLALQASPRGAFDAAYELGPIVVIVAALVLLRRWPVLMAGAGLLAVPMLLPTELARHLPLSVSLLPRCAQPLALVAVLAAAQAMLRRGETGRGTLVAGLSVGTTLLGMAIADAWWQPYGAVYDWQRTLVVLGIAGAATAAWLLRGHDPAARPGGPEHQGWPRLRLVLAGGLALALAFPLGLLTPDRLAMLLGVSQSAMYRHAYVAGAVIGTITLIVVAALAAMAGPWSLGGALTAATAQVGMVAPLILAMGALRYTTLPFFSVLGGLAVGAGLAWTRLRVPLTAGVTVAAATALFIAYAATTGHPEKLASQGSVVPGILIAVLVTAAATAIVGTVAPTLAPSGAAPATLGPLAVVLALGGRQAIEATYLQDGLPASSYFNPVFHLTTSAVLLLVAAAGVGGLGFAQQWASRRADRLRAEQIRREAAEAERNRLARPIHDGVLQVLALMQRHGNELGGAGPQLATLAGEQEQALRNLLSGGPIAPAANRLDVRATLTALASPTIEVAAPAEPVLLPADASTELTAAVQAALDNVRRHAGPTARAWVLVEDEGDAVRVTVRDDGVGFAPERLTEAADAGRLGVAQSMRGRIADLGGTTEISSRPGKGTEVEFYVPRRRDSPT